MSDWTDEVQGFEERNYEELAEKFIEKYDKLWDEFVSGQFFKARLAERMGVMEP